MKKFILSKFNYALFDGEGAAEGASQGASSATDNGQTNEGDSKENILYGKQASPKGAAAELPTENQNGSNQTPKDLRAKYDEFMKDEQMKRFADQDMQKVINRRFRETKALNKELESQSGIIERLREKYGVESVEEIMNALDNDSALWEDAALQAGMDVDTFKRYRAMERKSQMADAFMERVRQERQANEQYDRWIGEANELKKEYPEFDLATELKNPNFRGLIGQKNPEYSISMRQAYEITHMDDIMNGVRQKTADETQKQVVDNVRSRGVRPQEGAVSQQSGVRVKSDVSQLTNDDIDEVLKRVRQGEIISFG